MNHKYYKNSSCQIALFSSKTASEAFCFDFQICVYVRLYRLGCKCTRALLAVTETRLKTRGKGKTKSFTKVFTRAQPILTCL